MTTAFYLFYILLMYKILKKEPSVVIIFFLFFLSQFLVYTSVFYIDFGNVKMHELGEVSNKSSLSIIVFFLLFTSVITIFGYFKIKKRILIKNMQERPKRIKHIGTWLILIYIIIFLLIFNIIISGSPLWVSSMNKTTFWDFAKLGFLKPISSQILIFSLFSGMFVLYLKINKYNKFLIKASYGILILLILYLVLMGHRFGQPLKIFYMFFLPILLHSSLQGNLSINKLVVRTIFILSIIFFITFNYFESKYGSYALDMLEQRIFAMEGQLTYVTLKDFFDGMIENSFTHLQYELSYIIGFDRDNFIGMQFLMYKLMPIDIFNFYIENKINLSKGYFPLMLYYSYGSLFFLFILNILVMLVLAHITYLFVKSILKFDFLLSALYSKLFFIINAFVGSGYLSIVLNLKTFLIIGIIIFIIYHRDRKRKKRIKIANITYN